MKLSKIIFGISSLLFLMYSALLRMEYPSVPEIIPIHYSAEGPDGFGNKIFLWLGVAFNALLLVFIGFILFFPQKMFGKNNDYLESSPEQAIKNRQIFLSVVSVIITLIFCGLSLKEIIL
ncbi:DUF1648 domain-containing protein [Chryseobacterium hagamense]|uniref:DUF1648 domain-containing protein n=1 Tax=Chryseobacterium hagamense TaxID=395935 RepID=A0A511YKW6_9FLAO|nr:DUF1648 domain-containing protein [Chryseobacterium hagamense]GEN75835.1 hypothetical protein CHA01nite_15750 [Chryseobacterium hagamense]